MLLRNTEMRAPVTLVLLLKLKTLIGYPIKPFIGHFEPVYYTPPKISRWTRSSMKHAYYEFSAYGRLFKLHLHRDGGVFTEDADVTLNQETVLHNYDRFNTFSGTLQDYRHYEEGTVSGIVNEDGLFEGTIYTSQDIYSVERSDQFFNATVLFHSIIFKFSDLSMGSWWSKNVHEAHNIHERLWKTQIQYNDSMGLLDDNDVKSREKRSVYDSQYVTCQVDIHIDHLFYSAHGKSNEKVLNLIKRYMLTLNMVFKEIDFDLDKERDGVNFLVRRVEIFSNPNQKSYQYRRNFGVESLLDKFSSLNNFDDTCLGYLFTHRDFEGGTLGLAWLGSPSSAVGGACSKNMVIRSAKKSLNTGLVSTLNFGNSVPFIASQYTLVHEVGHNMGAPHDDQNKDSTCVPGGKKGNFIMYSRANTGSQKNNNKFSHCSISSMHAFMSKKARIEAGCMTTLTAGMCGNGVVEANEECDCGWDDICKESCCEPMTKANPEKGCKLKANAQCSPSVGPCCNEQCRFASNGTECMAATTCSTNAVCTGANSTCPATVSRNENKVCNDSWTGKQKACKKGDCRGSLCNAAGLEPCQCKPSKDKLWMDETLCHLCCKLSNGECGSSFSSSQKFPDIIKKKKMNPGEACYDNQGFCDVFHKCRAVDPTGPLSRLKKMLIGLVELGTVKAWLKKYWYIVLSAGIVFFLGLGILIKVCSPKVPSDMPQKRRPTHKPALKKPSNKPQNQLKLGSKSKLRGSQQTPGMASKPRSQELQKPAGLASKSKLQGSPHGSPRPVAKHKSHGSPQAPRRQY